MKDLEPELLAAQKTATGGVVAYASLDDNGYPHFATLDDQGASQGATDAVLIGSVTVRIRVSGGKLYSQRVTVPADPVSWSLNWTEIVSGDVGEASLFYNGTYTVAVYQNTSTRAVRYRRSANTGLSWGTDTLAYAGFSNTVHIGAVSGGASQSGAFITGITAVNHDVWWGQYTSATDTWAALDDAGLALTAVNSISAFYDSANARHVVALVAQGITAWSYVPVATLARSTAGSWGSPRVFYGGATTSIEINNARLSRAKTNNYWWLTMQVITDIGYTTLLARSSEGEYWGNVAALDIETPVSGDALIVIGSVSSTVYAANGRYALSANALAYWEDQVVTRYQFETVGPGGVIADILNPAGALIEPNPFALFDLYRGFKVNGIDYAQPIGRMHVIGWQHNLQDNILRLEGVDALGVLNFWEADQIYRWEGETIQTLVKLICALGGVYGLTFDAAGVWSDTVGAFIVNPGASALDALRSLLVRATAEARPTESGSLYCWVPTASPESAYTYDQDSTTGHLYWPGKFGGKARPNHLTATSNAASVIAEANDAANQLLCGRRISNTIVDQRLAAQADAEEMVASRLLVAGEVTQSGEFESPPNFALEAGDVISFADGVEAGLSPWRVTGFVETFKGNKRSWMQKVELRGVT